MRALSPEGSRAFFQAHGNAAIVPDGQEMTTVGGIDFSS